MQNKKQKMLNKLKIFYLAIFILGTVIVAPTHLFPPPNFMYARFPHYLEMMPRFLGISWPATFGIYHLVLLLVGVIGLINVLGLVFSNMQPLAKLSSLAGIFLFSLIVLFFLVKFASVNLPTAIIYGIYSVILLIADLLTFKALVTRQTKA